MSVAVWARWAAIIGPTELSKVIFQEARDDPTFFDGTMDRLLMHIVSLGALHLTGCACKQPPTT
ncbi:MAG: hypothetical protein DI540_06950 [Sphingobium sp.]|jgi:hypothetical protein|nr:MAG: hypothetical protein DI540_06950 [Sphingobium sp.]